MFWWAPAERGMRIATTAELMAAAQQAADDARHDADAAKADVARLVDEGVAHFRSTYPGRLQFPFRFKANEAPFHVAAIYTDGTFTYIRAAATELPSLYEVRDEAPNLINFQVENGLYIVPKVLTRGYLAIGKRRLPFERVP
jgi:Conjugal transfer protein